MLDFVSDTVSDATSAVAETDSSFFSDVADHLYEGMEYGVTALAAIGTVAVGGLAIVTAGQVVGNVASGAWNWIGGVIDSGFSWNKDSAPVVVAATVEETPAAPKPVAATVVKATPKTAPNGPVTEAVAEPVAA